MDKNLHQKANQFGMFKKDDIKEIDLPIFDFTITDYPGISVEMITNSGLKQIGINLIKEEREKLKIVGFLKMNGYRGYAPLYSLKEVLKMLPE